MLDLLRNYDFLRYAIFASLCASVICGIVGTVIVEKKKVMLAGGIAHAAYGGVGLGYLCSVEPMIGAAVFALAAAFAIGYIERKGGAKSDVLTAMFWSLGMALGVVFIGLTPGYAPDVSSYLFGNILTVTTTELWLMLALAVLLAAIFAVFWGDWKSFLFDSEFAAILGAHTALMEYTVLAVTALSVVVLIKATGIILVMALLSVPAMTSALLAKSLAGRMVLATVLSAVFSLGGLALSYALSVASGAAIVLVAVAVYVVLFLVKRR